MINRETWQRRLFGFQIPLLLYVVFLLFPFYWMLVVSLKPDNDLFNVKLDPFFVQHVTLAHYAYLFQNTSFLRWALNTTVVTVASTVLSIVCSILIGYALGRMRFPGANFLGVAIFLAYLVPPTLLFLPLAQIINSLHLYNTYWSLILTYPSFLIPFAGWLLTGYFRTVPREIEECAMIDGASRLRTMVSVILPLAVPGILSAAIFSFTLSWNEFLYALIFMGTGNMKTIPVGTVSDLIKSDVYFWGSLMAAALLGSVPVAIAYSFFVENYVSGLTAGAVKG
jgi:multiple sugar transport system permease protein